MELTLLSPRKSLNKAYLKVKPTRNVIELFKKNLIGLLDGVFPSGRAMLNGDHEDIEEEQRLLYVAVTRAKEELFLSLSNKNGADDDRSQLCRFLEPENVRITFEERKMRTVPAMPVKKQGRYSTYRRLRVAMRD